jgi:molybdenum cofactor cytidylyltransferase
MSPAILILAAGSSSRMRGADKLLEMIDGQPQLCRITAAALATGCPVTLCLPPDAAPRRAALAGLAVTAVVADHALAGMAESLKAGVAALPHGSAVLLLLADLPDLTADDLDHCLATWRRHPDRILRGTAQDGKPGHPVGFPPDLRGALLALSGDQGARDILAANPDRLLLVALPGAHATTDLDTPEDWARWRASRP